MTWVYWLNPHWGDGDPSCVPNQGQATCGGCYACVSHYQNKLFATSAAADAGRAHTGCKCLVEAAFTVDAATYAALFADGNASVDRRTPGVNEILAGSTSAPSPTTDPATGTATASDPPPGDGVLAFTGSAIGPLAAIGAGAVAVGAVMQRLARRNEQPATTQ